MLLEARGVRLVIVTALLCGSGLGLAVAQPGNESEEVYSGGGCYGCHRIWSPVPMKTMYRILPPEKAADIGSEFSYGVEVQQAWVAQPPWPKLMRFEANLNVTQAPSLGFTSDISPLLGVQSYGVIPASTSATQAPKAHVSIDVPVRASDLVITLSPNSTDPSALGDELTMKVYPMRPNVGGSPTYIINSTGPGESVRFVVHGGGNITALGIGKWGIQAELNATTTEPRKAYFAPNPIPFTVTVDAYFNTTGEGLQYVLLNREVEAGQSTIIPFRLFAVAVPAPGENVVVTVNTLAFYPHSAGPVRDDWGNFTKTYKVQVFERDGKLVIGPPTNATPAATIAAPATLFSLDRISEAVGYLSAFLLIASIVSGGMFGAASRRSINRIFGTARRRVAFHNVLSYFLTLAAGIHTVLFVIEANYEWTLGIIWGGIALLAMLGLGVTGALQVSMVRTWSYGWWKWTHYGLAVAAITFTIVHMLLDGANFGMVQDAVGWDDPFPDNSEV